MLSRIGITTDQALPSESTMRRTLALLDANDLDARLAGWMATRVGHLAGRRVIAVDGKTMRGARTTDGAPHLVAAFDQSAGAVLGQLAVATKSNEIPALRDLLDSMDITDAVVSADAMHCQRETAKHITGRGAHYVLTMKANHQYQGTQDNRSGLRDLLAGHDRRATGHRRHLDPGPLGNRERAPQG